MAFYPKYNELVETALQSRMVAPRGELTFEVRGPVLLETNGRTTAARKGLNTKLGAVEALMMIAGIFDFKYIRLASATTPKDIWMKQSDYGSRLNMQMSRALNLLREDRESRRAVVYLNYERHFQTDDLACSTAIHFMIRNGTLETTMNVRSWDIAWGLPMDIMTHSILGQAVARCLGVMPGPLFATGNSVHVYAKTLKQAIATADIEFTLGASWPEPGYWAAFQQRARTALDEFEQYGEINPGVINIERIA